MKRTTIALAMVGAIVSIASGAQADAITMPLSCPESSEDAFCHGPATCRPRACVSPTDCSAGEICAARSLCTETHTCSGLGGSTSFDHVLGPCDAAGACGSGVCRSLFVCAPGPILVDAATPGADAGDVREHVSACGCRAGQHGGSASALFALALAWVLRFRRSLRADATR